MDSESISFGFLSYAHILAIVLSPWFGIFDSSINSRDLRHQ
jgi:hypothetical protein